MIDLLTARRRDDPLAHPSGARVFAALADAEGDAPIDELAERTGLHANSVRLYLRRLEAAGLAEVTNERRPGRGRPRQMWRLVPGAEPAGAPPVAYSELAGWLSDALTPAEAVAQGRRIGADRAAALREYEADAAAALEYSLTSMGFQPRRAGGGGERGRITLCNCPYRDVARSNPRVICSLHRGIAEGFVQAVDPTQRVARFDIKDPEAAGCAIELGPRTGTKAEQQGRAAT